MNLKNRSLFALSILAFGMALASSGLAQRGGFNMRAPILPDRAITPGAALDVTREDVCTPGYSRKVRNVPQSVKEQAYRNYGISHREKGEYEVDHLISLEIGGSNSIKNLWPESFKTQPWNAYVKDELENELHAEVCSGKIELKTAQRDIARDWIAAYKRVFHTDLPKSRMGRRGVAGGRRSSASTSRIQVWVNLNSGAYWRPGTQYYGKTKNGKYMSEQDAIQAGYHAAGRKR